MAETPQGAVRPVRREIPAPVAEGSLRVDAITHVPAVLRELGLDPDALLAEAGLAPRLFEDPANEVPIAGLGRLLARAVAESGCDHVGLLIGERSRPASMGLVWRLPRHAPDVGTALRNLSAQLDLRDGGAVAPLLVADGIARLGYEICQRGVEAGDQICDGSLAIAMNLMRSLCGPAWRPTEVRFARSRPGDLRPFQRVFAAPLHFDTERNVLAFEAKWLEAPTRERDPELFRELTGRFEALEPTRTGDLVAELRRMLRVLLLTGTGSVGEVADRLSLHRRTLNRRLRARGTSVHRLVEETRSEIALQLVERTGMRLTDIAATLGYADASAFTRAFQRWTGRPPSAWRRQPRGARVAKCQAAPGAASYAGPPRQRRGSGGRPS